MRESRNPEDRFELIYRDTYQRTLAYVRRRAHGTIDADDVVAETYVVAWRRLDEFCNVEEPQAWLYAVAYRTLSNHRRSSSRQLNLADKVRHASANELRLDPAWSIEKRDEYTRVVQAMERLPERDREVLRLAAYEELDHAAIGMVLGIRTPLVRTVLYRARRKLNSALESISPPPRAVDGRKEGKSGPRDVNRLRRDPK